MYVRLTAKPASRNYRLHTYMLHADDLCMWFPIPSTFLEHQRIYQNSDPKLTFDTFPHAWIHDQFFMSDVERWHDAVYNHLFMSNIKLVFQHNMLITLVTPICATYILRLSNNKKGRTWGTFAVIKIVTHFWEIRKKHVSKYLQRSYTRFYCCCC